MELWLNLLQEQRLNSSNLDYGAATACSSREQQGVSRMEASADIQMHRAAADHLLGRV